MLHGNLNKMIFCPNCVWGGDRGAVSQGGGYSSCEFIPFMRLRLCLVQACLRFRFLLISILVKERKFFFNMRKNVKM